MNLNKCKINILGDSITEGVGASSSDRCFVSVLAARTGAICRNYGIGGTRIAFQKKSSAEPHWDYDFCSRVSGMDNDTDCVIVFGGTNDYGTGDAEFGSMSDRSKDTFYGALHVLYRSLIERFTDAKIVIVTPLHRCNEENPRGDGKAADGPVLKEYIRAIREVAEYYSLPVLDLYAVSGLQPEIAAIKERFMPDGLHPSDAGHEMIAERMQKFLEAL